MIWFHYPVWIKGEALRQILVNRYYGNIRPSGRRESLTSFGNGPLSPGGPSKPGGGGRLCAVLMSVMCELSMSHVAVCFCLTTWNLDVFVLAGFFVLFIFVFVLQLLLSLANHQFAAWTTSPIRQHFPTFLHVCFATSFVSLFHAVTLLGYEDGVGN